MDKGVVTELLKLFVGLTNDNDRKGTFEAYSRLKLTSL